MGHRGHSPCWRVTAAQRRCALLGFRSLRAARHHRRSTLAPTGMSWLVRLLLTLCNCPCSSEAHTAGDLVACGIVSGRGGGHADRDVMVHSMPVSQAAAGRGSRLSPFGAACWGSVPEHGEVAIRGGERVGAGRPGVARFRAAGRGQRDRRAAAAGSLLGGRVRPAAGAVQRPGRRGCGDHPAAVGHHRAVERLPASGHRGARGGQPAPGLWRAVRARPRGRLVPARIRRGGDRLRCPRGSGSRGWTNR